MALLTAAFVFLQILQDKHPVLGRIPPIRRVGIICMTTFAAISSYGRVVIHPVATLTLRGIFLFSIARQGQIFAMTLRLLGITQPFRPIREGLVGIGLVTTTLLATLLGNSSLVIGTMAELTLHDLPFLGDWVDRNPLGMPPLRPPPRPFNPSRLVLQVTGMTLLTSLKPGRGKIERRCMALLANGHIRQGRWAMHDPRLPTSDVRIGLVASVTRRTVTGLG